MVGAALLRQLQQNEDNELITRSHDQLDLRDQAAVAHFYAEEAIDTATMQQIRDKAMELLLDDPKI